MENFERVINKYLQWNFYFTILLPMPCSPLINQIYRLCWLAYLFGAMFLMFYWRLNGGDNSIGGLAGTALFVSNDFAAVVTIFEALLGYSKYQEISRLQRELDELLQHHLHCCMPVKFKRSFTILTICVIASTLFFCETLRACIIYNSKVNFSPVFFYSIPIGQVLKWRYIQIIVILMKFNAHIELLQLSIRQQIEQNKPKRKYCSDVWRAYTKQEYDKLNEMRLIYGRIHELFGIVNEWFGWSILIIFLTSFFDFVCNAFWTYSAMLKGEQYGRYFFNGATVISLATLVYALFWCSDASTRNSHYIGCLIFKLVKPLGNKQYNDLVSEFSLQVLHQQFVITAKDFFELNLNLLGTMVASIVTYLVILIQFMLTERSSNEILTIEPFNNSTLIFSNVTNT